MLLSSRGGPLITVANGPLGLRPGQFAGRRVARSEGLEPPTF